MSQFQVFSDSRTSSSIIDLDQSLINRSGPTGGIAPVAEFIRQGAQSGVNGGIPLKYGTIVNNNLGIILNDTGLTGTSMTITVPGLYQFNYGTLLSFAGCIALYQAPYTGASSVTDFDKGLNSTPINNSFAGSSTTLTWLQGSAYVNITSPTIIGLCIYGLASGNVVAIAGFPTTTRLQVQKIA